MLRSASHRDRTAAEHASITIIGTTSIRHLYHFIFADERQRGPHIRAITIPLQPMLPDPPEELVDHLLAVFASATRITKLSLYIPMVNQFRLFNHPGLLAAIAGMTTLQELTILSPTRPAIDLLWSTRSSLKVFRHSDMYGTYEVSALPAHKPAPQLASSLQEVELSHNFLVAAFDSSVCFSERAARNPGPPDARPRRIQLGRRRPPPEKTKWVRAVWEVDELEEA